MSIDEAYKEYYSLAKAWKESGLLDKDLSETDTRVKLIDPVFLRVLGWPENSIQREESNSEGFADYTFSDRGRRLLLVEAKSLLPRFSIAPATAKQGSTLGSPSLSDKKLQKAIVQVAGYGAALGCPYSIATDGVRYVVFQSVVATPLPERAAVVFTDLLDKVQFRTFFELLSFSSAQDGSLPRCFLSFTTRARLYAATEFIDHPKRELRRNRFWSALNHLATRVLEDRPETRSEIIQNCYVPTRESNETDEELRALLQRPAAPLVRESNSTSIKPVTRGRTSFGNALEDDLKRNRSGVYVLTGGVGSGKTTFLYRFVTHIEPVLVRQYAVWLHVDYLPKGKPTPDQLITELESFSFRRIREQLEDGYGDQVSVDGEGLRTLFAEELKAIQRTRLHRISPESDKYNEIVNSEIDRLYKSDREFVRAALRVLQGRGKRVVFVLDNSDQLGEDYQERVFLFARSLQTDFGAIAIVSLREEKFYAAYYRGVFNAFPSNKFHLGSPDLQEVLRRRLLYGIDLMKRSPKDFVPGEGDATFSSEDCEQLLHAFVRSVTKKNRNIIRLLDSVAAGNMRFGLELFRDFVGSGNTDVDKIIRAVRRSGGYIVPFHEFVKSVMLDNREIYSTDSVIANVYACSGAPRSSHFTALRILDYLQQRQTTPSAHGPGFIDAQAMRRLFGANEGTADDFEATVGHLVRKGLVESEPPLAVEQGRALAFKIGAAGWYYLKFLCRSFAYFDLIIQDTPFRDETMARHIAAVARIRDLDVRVERVTMALNYFARAEAEELARMPTGDPLSNPLMPGIREQLEREMEILRRMGSMSQRQLVLQPS